MKEFCIKHKRILIDIAVLLGVFVFVSLSYYIFKPIYFKSVTGFGTSDGLPNRLFIYTCLLGVIIAGVILKLKKQLTTTRLLFLIFLVGVLMQLNYMLITPYNYRQHDVFSSTNAGHQGYAWTIYSTGHLPTQLDKQGHLDYQFYHPPLNAAMQALFMNISKPFMQLFNGIYGNNGYYNINNMNSLFQTSEILSCFYMNVATYFGIKIAYKLKVKDIYKICGALFIALFPALMILAAQENNDPLCIMNCFIVIYFTVAWWENKSYFNATMIGIFTGLAMMAKLSGALIILPAFVAFMIELISTLKKKEPIKHIILQGVIIAFIAAPLGLWFHIYAKICFNQPFGFVFSNLNSKLYTGDHNFFERFINIFDFGDMTTAIWGNTFVNYNVPNFMIKSALFGEYSFIHADAFAVLSLIFHYLFTYTSLALMIIYLVCSKKANLHTKVIAGTLVASQLLAQLYFNIKMPYGCTMDFRYVVPIILGFMIFDVMAFDEFISDKGWKKYYSLVVLFIGGIFLINISLFYLTAI